MSISTHSFCGYCVPLSDLEEFIPTERLEEWNNIVDTNEIESIQNMLKNIFKKLGFIPPDYIMCYADDDLIVDIGHQPFAVWQQEKLYKLEPLVDAVTLLEKVNPTFNIWTAFA